MRRPTSQPAHRCLEPASGRRRVRPVLLGLALAAALSGCAVPPAQPGGVQAVRLRGVQGYLEFAGRQREEDQKSKVGTGDTHSKESIFQESVRLDTAGSIYHPNLLDFTLGGLFGLLQHSFQQTLPTSDIGGSDQGTVWEYDFTGNFLKQKKYPGTVYARRRQGIEPRAFQSSVQTTTDSYGALWQYLSDKMPTRLQFSYIDVLYHPFDRTLDQSDRKNLNFRLDTAYKFSDHNVLSFLYEHQSVDQHTRGTAPFNLSYNSDELTLGHRWDFGGEHQHKLESELNYYRQQGSFDTERLRWREVLRLRHTDSLRSWYEAEIRDQTRGSLAADLAPIKEQSYRVSATLEHRLYESLVSQGLVWAQKQDFKSGANIDRYGAEARFDYQKNNPLGVLRANYNARIEQEQRQGKEMRAEIRDERQTFRDPDPITLGHANIETGTIVLTAPDGITVYQLARDYTVRTFGDRVELERVPTGRIADGDAVLIDYVYKLGGTFTLDTVNQNLGVRQDFTFGLSPYYQLRWQDQTITPVTASGGAPEDITAHILGVQFRRWGLDAAAEYEDHFSSINSFDALRLRAGYSQRFKWGGTASVRTNWTDTTYAPPRDRETRLLTIEGRYRQLIRNQFTAEGAVQYRSGRDSLTGPHEGVDLSFSLEWLIRKTELRITGEFKQFDNDFAKNSSSSLYFQIRRKF